MYNTFIDGSPPESEDEQQHQQTRVQARQRTRTLPKAGTSAPQRPYVKFPAAFLLIVALIIWIGFLGGDRLVSGLLTSATTTTTVYQTATSLPGHESKALPTLPAIAQPIGVQPADNDVSLPIPASSGIAGNEATSQVMFQATAAAAAQATPVPDTHVTIPAQQVPVDVGPPPAAAVVPVTTPLNIQVTHTCYHGQVWVDGAGCRWPNGALSDRHGTKSTP